MPLIKKLIILSIITSFCMILLSCDNSKHLNELKNYVQKVKTETKPTNTKEEKSFFVLPKPVVYSNEQMGQDVNAVNPNVNPMQAYPLKSYQFVGTLSEGNTITAYILAPNQITYQVRDGDTIGNRAEKIIKIYNDHIDVAVNSTANTSQQKIATIKLKD